MGLAFLEGSCICDSGTITVSVMGLVKQCCDLCYRSQRVIATNMAARTYRRIFHDLTLPRQRKTGV